MKKPSPQFATGRQSLSPEKRGGRKLVTHNSQQTDLSLTPTPDGPVRSSRPDEFVTVNMQRTFNQLSAVSGSRPKIGFTGTRKGLTEKQSASLHELLRVFCPTEFHHGCCVGSDLQSEEVMLELIREGMTCELHQHPPTDMRLAEVRTFPGVETILYTQKLYLDRNREIVDAVDVMVACPAEKEEQKRGGTWYTVRYTIKQGVGLYILYP
jgi:hypothetical protein